MRRRSRLVRPKIEAIGLITIVLLATSACGVLPGTQTQPHGLPPLHQIDWGYAYFDQPAWSPNGRWIAVLAGQDFATSHLEVVSPDGHFKQDLSAWKCGESGMFSFAWLPDSSLSCINDSVLVTGSYPFLSWQVTNIVPALTPDANGVAWSADGSSLIVASFTTPGDPTRTLHNGILYLVSREGKVSLEALSSPDQEVESPAWVPGNTALTYIVVPDLQTGLGNLVIRKFTQSSANGYHLGPPKPLAEGIDQRYSWSPSGRWIAVRHVAYSGGDKVYLVDPAKPSETVDVVLADEVGQQMTNPIWSPDGQTMIVFSVGYDTSTPYELDIGAYLKSKGLQP